MNERDLRGTTLVWARVEVGLSEEPHRILLKEEGAQKGTNLWWLDTATGKVTEAHD